MLRRSTSRYARIPVAAVAALAVACGIGTTQAYADAVPPGAAAGWSPQPSHSDDGAKPGDKPRSVPQEKRAEVLGKNYRNSSDRAFTTSGDGTGFHVMVADEKNGYRWKTAASLLEPGFETDTWIGNACVTGSGRYAAVAYAPRTFTNKPELMSRGAFTAVVDLGSGSVRKLPFQATLGYFSPGCGSAEDVVFSQFTDELTAKKNETRLISADARTGRADSTTVAGQVTSAVPVDGTIVAARGRQIVRIDGSAVTTVARTHAVPFQLKPDAEGGVTFIDRLPGGSKRSSADDQAAVSRVTAGAVRAADGKAKAAQLARGALTRFDLTRTPQGAVYVTGEARTSAKLPGSVRNPGGIDKDARVSSRGAAALTTAWADGRDSRVSQRESLAARPVRITLKALDTGGAAVLDAMPGDRLGSAAAQRSATATSPALSGPEASGGMSATATTIDTDRTCSVPRNDPKKQAFQPTPRQIEWAVDQAVVGNLNAHASRPSNWKNTGMSAYSPQGLFPLKAMSGGSGTDWHIPAQVMLGITAQESNMWQATRFAVPGVTANPLIGNFYGVKYASDGTQYDPWAIDWSESDCGYGVTQVTDGMRLPGKGQPTMTVAQQEAVALDYAANIAAGVNILVDKWNQTRADGLIVNDGHPKYIENWFFALWAYNSGYYPQSSAGSTSGKWGVGWTNNPANPLWKENRTPFLENSAGGDDYSHAAHPQDWPYEEKVIGWAARPISAMFGPGDFQPGYRAAWWTTVQNRTAAKPPIGLFCDSSNDCDPSKISEGADNDTGGGPCLLPGDPNESDPLYLKCWFHNPVTWKNCTSSAQCGHPVHRFNTTYPEQPDANSYPPRCSAGLPSGTRIVDDVPNGVTPAGSTSRSCGAASSSGTFDLTFGTSSARIDLHQIGAAYGNHFWFSHTNKEGTAVADRLKTTGKWTLGTSDRGWMRVWVHLPDHGAHTRQAMYTVGGTTSTSPARAKPQRVLANTWVPLGAFNFTGTPTVSLSNVTQDGDGTEDVAWDAVGFEPLAGKPANQIVAMGDSYASGEGASENGGDDYYRESDYYDASRPNTENTCHRSKHAWSRQATLPGHASSIGALADSMNPGMDYQFVACSGARHYNIIGDGQNGELGQIEHGYLDQNTTLVALSIGGNDMRFADIMRECITAATVCNNNSIEAVDPDTGKKIEGQETGPLDQWAPVWARDTVRPRLVTTLDEIHQRAPNAKIVLMGYPRLLENNGQCVIGIGTAEAPWLNEMADTLAAEMQGAVDDANLRHSANAVFSDPRDEFAGKAICGDPETVHGIVLSGHSKADNRDWNWLPGNVAPSMKSFHPKVPGARLYADSLESSL
ncbi:SGNH/GDSL hydrolase family protein [Streptomyces tirandamycinicus]|uniref:SGNH/GDSL hydrolase family protein n=1 Tax=Streptomyces tirandamycinicus TaxID=2174846 RepID=UPI00226E2805|nr:SGNH/GDSL hydrolase family protein [Streptomyces tirandamycinicus]MCY0983740.1 SGNH/GDSL hydrolase family protein [Streptomyces tirandamycinicus]